MESKQYDHIEVETKWTNFWLDNKLFKTRINANKGKFSIALPPPNVTGELHMGHALGGTIQDALIRYQRMLGKDVLWQIGTDHAGIGTQLVVEKFLKKTENKSKYDLGRENFIKRVQAWKEEYGNKIIEQMKLLGFSPDYERVRYTMDDAYASSVKQAFIQYYNDGLIYRGNRITNWCPKCLTSLSDLEISKEKNKKKLYKIRYRIKDSQDYLTVATTRPETMFGDQAVAINPEDTRYSHLIDRSIKLIIPFTDKEIPLILDTSVKTDFGTGALKVTPAHDANDYEIAIRHNLARVIIMDKNGLLKADHPIPIWLHGLDRFKARELIVERLGEELVGIDEYEQEKELHDRCNTEIEPYLSDQWYLSMKKLAKLALEAESNGRTQFIPERYSLIFSNWLNNIQDWCISRQIWWGHQIPIYYYEENGLSKHYAAETARDPSHRQDQDVLDTWFSSALWPFVTMLDEKEIFENFYPTNVLATAREIINLWVSRMIYSSEYFYDKEPFGKILIHPVVQTPDGKRMSKSKGNAIDPLELIQKYGADASRMWYASVGIYGAQDVKFPGKFDKKEGWSSDQFEQYRKFANKLFNATRYLTLQLNEDKDFRTDHNINIAKCNNADKWILSKFTKTLAQIKNAYNNYDLATAQKVIYEFLWYDFCDWYIELSKINQSTEQNKILFYVLESSLRALHPIMPFITEELWQTLNNNMSTNKSICFAEFPEANLELLDKSDASLELELLIKIVSALRQLRQSLNIPWSKAIKAYVQSTNNTQIKVIQNNIDIICKIAKLDSIEFGEEQIAKPLNITIVEELNLIVPLQGLIDIDKLKTSLEKKLNKLDQDISILSSRLESANFIANADPNKISDAQNTLSQIIKERKLYSAELECLK
jgi:valyl-tRNA synthetase